MKTIKAIRTEANYAAALARVEQLMDAEYGTPEGEELDVLADLIDHYEARTLDLGYPTPIEAIKFRMEQGELSVRDLIPLIGSRSKVSEVLAGKREITMQMAKALHQHLGIPAEVFLRRNTEIEVQEEDGAATIDWGKFPIKTLLQAGWISGRKSDSAEKLMAPLAKFKACAAERFYRKSSRENAKADSYSLLAWCLYVQKKATALVSTLGIKTKYVPGTVTNSFLVELAKLSRAEDGPLLAQKKLAEVGIVLVIVPHLPRTYLDGAAMKLADGRPVVAITLRYDRIDNFWFCLLHELAHVANDLDKGSNSVLDDLSLEPSDKCEEDADKMASDGLIPPNLWDEFYSRGDFSPLAVMNFAAKLEIHPAIVAGRVRFKEKNYRLLTQFVGSGQITPLFPDFKKVA